MWQCPKHALTQMVQNGVRWICKFAKTWCLRRVFNLRGTEVKLHRQILQLRGLNDWLLSVLAKAPVILVNPFYRWNENRIKIASDERRLLCSHLWFLFSLCFRSQTGWFCRFHNIWYSNFIAFKDPQHPGQCPLHVLHAVRVYSTLFLLQWWGNLTFPAVS